MLPISPIKHHSQQGYIISGESLEPDQFASTEVIRGDKMVLKLPESNNKIT